VAFIAINNGKVSNLTLEGNVNASIAAKTGKDYLVAGVAAVNNGTIENVVFNGAVNVESTSLNAFVTIRVATGVAQGDKAGVTANVTIDAVSKFDVANVKIFVDGSAKEVNTSCKNAAVENGALVKFVIE
ncbi:MAG: hypothetical protein K2L53_01735, partial [Clostridia bacterium]|nr:hypothetical protein [Clostridia bacterium]